MNLTALPGCVVKVLGNGLPQTTMLIRDDEGHALQSSPSEPAECFVPSGEALAVADLHAENLAHAVATHPADDQHRAHQHTIFLPTLDEHRIDQHERILAFQSTFVECPDANIES